MRSSARYRHLIRSAGWLVVALSMGVIPPPSSAGSFNPFESALEAMIQSKTDETILLPLSFGAAHNSITFNSMVDPRGQSFSYSTQAGSLYNGQPLMISVSGTLRSDSTGWDWTTEGSLGSSSWSGTGSILYLNDPPHTQISRDDKPPRKMKLKDGVVRTVEVKSSTTNTFYDDGTVTSNSGYVILADGVPIKTDDSFDTVEPLTPDLKSVLWEDNLKNSNINFSGFNNGITGVGRFTMQAVPEPPGWVLSTIALLACGLFGLSRKRTTSVS